MLKHPRKWQVSILYIIQTPDLSMYRAQDPRSTNWATAPGDAVGKLHGGKCIKVKGYVDGSTVGGKLGLVAVEWLLCIGTWEH